MTSKTRKKLFIKRKFLNHQRSASTGTVYAYSGPAPWDPSQKQTSTFFEIADCHQSARLHLTEADSKSDFIHKLKKIVKTANAMIRFLENK